MDIDPLASRITVEWDWVLTRHGDRLHCPELWDDPEYDAYTEKGRTACGRKSALTIPGVFTRMGAMRCEHCCRITGFPPGKGSPKNDDSCRPLVEERLRQLGLDPPSFK